MMGYLETIAKNCKYPLIISYLEDVSASRSSELFWKNYSKVY